MIREKMEMVNIDSRLLNRSLNEGFSGGEKKKNEIFQMVTSKHSRPVSTADKVLFPAPFGPIIAWTSPAFTLIIKGYAGDVINKMPMEFAVEAQKLLQISLAGSVG